MSASFNVVKWGFGKSPTRCAQMIVNGMTCNLARAEERVGEKKPTGIHAVFGRYFSMTSGTGMTLKDLSLIQSCNQTLQVANVLMAQDYYPFGMTMHNRRGEDLGGEHRYGFNGKEKDDEVHGSGNQYDYGFRIYNPRIARFLSVDPLFQSYPWYTPYQFAGNKPIWCIDIDGLEEGFATIEHTISKDGVTTIMWKVVPNFSPKPSDMGKVQYTYPDGRTVMK